VEVYSSLLKTFKYLWHIITATVCECDDDSYHSLYMMLRFVFCNSDDNNNDNNVAVAAGASLPSSVPDSNLNVEVKQGSLPEFSVCFRLLHVNLSIWHKMKFS